MLMIEGRLPSGFIFVGECKATFTRLSPGAAMGWMSLRFIHPSVRAVRIVLYSVQPNYRLVVNFVFQFTKC